MPWAFRHFNSHVVFQRSHNDPECTFTCSDVIVVFGGSLFRPCTGRCNRSLDGNTKESLNYVQFAGRGDLNIVGADGLFQALDLPVTPPSNNSDRLHSCRRWPVG